jgi:homoserine dehydrogenase
MAFARQFKASLPACPSQADANGLAIVVVGPGRVGSVVVDRLLSQTSRWRLAGLGNSTRMLTDTADRRKWRKQLASSEQPGNLESLTEHLLSQQARKRVVVDATASQAVAARHADWLEAGCDVVTANKWAMAAAQPRYRHLAAARRDSGQCYEHAATVGAGLPALAAIAALHAAGEPLLAVGGALSGTMTFLTGRINAGQAPSQALAEAVTAGLTEPDPRADLDGLDVARKLVILAREAGQALDLSDIAVESLVPPELASLSPQAFLEATDCLDAYWHKLARSAPGQGEVLRHVGRFDVNGTARVGLERVGRHHPLAALGDADNLIEIRTASYDQSPLVLRGPGAGIEVTALALWSGLCRVSECGRPCR